MRTEPRTSRLFRDLAQNLPGDRVTIRHIEAAMQDRAYGLLILVFALPNLVPTGLPGISTVLGVPLLLLAIQLIAGWQRPWIPEWIARRSFPSAEFARATARVVPWLERIEKVLKPRLPAMTARAVERFVVGGAALLMALALALPIPFGNWIPALALVFLALGLLEEDGLAVAVGLALGGIGIALVVAVVLGGAEAVQFLTERVF